MGMYLDYWNLDKHPFNNVPDPGMYFDRHRSVDAAVAKLISAINGGNNSLAVITGPAGAGKTTSLRMVLSRIEEEKHNIAFVTNPDLTFPELLREIVGQLQGRECLETRKDRLLDDFSKEIFRTRDENKRTVIFIDEANVMKPGNLDGLRLLTNMQDDTENLFTIILAGQPELGRRLEHPKSDTLFQRIGVFCKIEGMNSLPITTDYIEHRLAISGLSGQTIFTPSAYEAIWQHSERGMPRLINKICKLSLKAGQTNHVTIIDNDIVNTVAERFNRFYRTPIKHTHSASVAHPANPGQSPLPAQMPEKLQAAEKMLTREAREDLASKMATEQFEKLDNITDPFETWVKLRRRILSELSPEISDKHPHAAA